MVRIQWGFGWGGCPYSWEFDYLWGRICSGLLPSWRGFDYRVCPARGAIDNLISQIPTVDVGIYSYIQKSVALHSSHIVLYKDGTSLWHFLEGTGIQNLLSNRSLPHIVFGMADRKESEQLALTTFTQPTNLQKASLIPWILPRGGAYATKSCFTGPSIQGKRDSEYQTDFIPKNMCIEHHSLLG